jgi:hypothetical protein
VPHATFLRPKFLPKNFSRAREPHATKIDARTAENCMTILGNEQITILAIEIPKDSSAKVLVSECAVL